MKENRQRNICTRRAVRDAIVTIFGLAIAVGGYFSDEVTWAMAG